MSGLILVGVIEGAFGVKGEARVRSFTTPPENLFVYAPLLHENGAVALTPKAWRALGEAFAVTAAEIAQREDAMKLRGTRLYAPREKFAAPEEDEFYVVDLIGCTAENAAGAAIGVVSAVHDFGAGDILEIQPPAGPALQIAFTRANAPMVDLKRRRIVLDPPPEEEA
ncbi:MAG: ribosome maturation factor RimM [Hyphomonadaceae bacterium]